MICRGAAATCSWPPCDEWRLKTGVMQTRDASGKAQLRARSEGGGEQLTAREGLECRPRRGLLSGIANESWICVRTVSDAPRTRGKQDGLARTLRYTSVLREVADSNCVDACPCASARAEGIYFQACSFSHSDISYAHELHAFGGEHQVQTRTPISLRFSIRLPPTTATGRWRERRWS